MRPRRDTVEQSVAVEVTSEVPCEVPSEETTPAQRRADAIGFLAERALQGGLVETGGGRAAGECGDGKRGDGKRSNGRAAATVSRADRLSGGSSRGC